MNYQTEALNWVRKYGLKPMDIRTAQNAIKFLINDALNITETEEDIDLCNKARLNAMEYAK